LKEKSGLKKSHLAEMMITLLSKEQLTNIENNLNGNPKEASHPHLCRLPGNKKIKSGHFRQNGIVSFENREPERHGIMML
jgi:hypothetical protein